MPWDFWRLTPSEFEELIKAYEWKDEQVWQRTAWQTMHLINIWLDKKDKITLEDLIPQRAQPIKEQSIEEQIQVMEMWVAALGGVDKRKGVH